MENIRSVDELKAHLDEMKAEFDGLKKAVRKPDDAAVRKAAAYSKAFWEHMHTGMPENALREGSDGAGGYLVPDEYEDQLVEGLKEHNILRSLAHTIPTTHDLRIPVVLSNTTAQWVNENGDYPDTELCFGQTVISAYKVATSVLVSDELLEDSGIDLEDYILKEMSAAIGDAEEEAFFRGNGSGKPTGLVSQVSVGAVSAEVGDICIDDVIDLIYSVRKPYREKSVLVMSDDAYFKLHKTKYANGRYIWNPNYDKDGYETFSGFRVYTTKNLDVIDSGNIPVLFGCFDYYWIGDRGKRVIKRLVERYADHGQVAYISSERVDAKLVHPEAIKGLKIKTPPNE